MYKFVYRVRFSVSVSALIALLAGLALTGLLFVSERRSEVDQFNLQFQQQAGLRVAAVTTGLHDAVDQVRVVNQLFQVVGMVSREQFRSFTKPLLERNPSIQALSFQRIIAQRDRRAYEATMQRLYPRFTITEVVNGKPQTAGVRASYNVVDYIEPLTGNEAALGLDTAMAADRMEARKASESTGQATATGLTALVQQKGGRAGFVVVAPVYRLGETPANRANTNPTAIGETAAVFEVSRLIESILGAGGLPTISGMQITVYDSPEADPAHLVASHGTPLDHAPGPWWGAIAALPSWLFFNTVEPTHQAFELAEKPWHIQVVQQPVLFTRHNQGSLYVLFAGLLTSLLAAAYVYTLASRKVTIERVTAERTASLHFANLRLTEDLAVRERTEKSLRLRERVIEVSTNAVIICNADGPDYAIEYVNPAFERITGYLAAEVVGNSLASLQGNSKDQRNIDEIRAALREKREGRALLRNYRKDGTGYWNELFIAPVQDTDGTISHFVVAQYDITSVMQFEAELEFQAHHDNLTGLANRNLLRDRLTHAIASAERNKQPVWVVFVDVDRFKFINDTVGLAAGDTLLKALAERLQAAVRDADTVARLGGDEFVLVLHGQLSEGPGMALLQRILDAVAEPLTVEGHEFVLTCSMGIASYPADGATAEKLIQHADIAMHRAKEMGRNTFQFYAPQMNARTLDRLTLETDLRHALERNEFEVHYQPQVSVDSGLAVGMEALIRWRHPVHGLIAPSRFIGLAEESGLIIPIGAWVLNTACQQTKAWQAAGFGDLRVAVNLSARQFAQAALIQTISDALASSGLEPQYLELELTESMIMSDVDSVTAVLRNLKSLGIHIAIDDFGTGYSSLSYLKRFPIDVLKIDQSFVADITEDADDAAIVGAIVSLAHSLRLKVIAEGVETQEQLSFLRAHGCDQMQGYLYSAAIPALAFEALLRKKAAGTDHQPSA